MTSLCYLIIRQSENSVQGDLQITLSTTWLLNVFAIPLQVVQSFLGHEPPISLQDLTINLSFLQTHLSLASLCLKYMKLCQYKYMCTCVYVQIFWVYILGFYFVISIHAYMYTYIATHFSNFIMCLIVKYLFLF